MSAFDPEPFNTDAHRAAQDACRCLIHCAVDGKTRAAVIANLNNARATGDVAAIPVHLAQLTGHCCLAPAGK